MSEQIKKSITTKQELIQSLKSTLEIVKKSLEDDIEIHQSLCKHEFIAEHEPYERTTYRCNLCGKSNK
jgi:hypothetical protein